MCRPGWGRYAALRSAFGEDGRRSGKEAAMVETQAVNERRAADLRLRAGRPEDAERLGSICYGAFEAIAEGHNFPPDFSSPEFAVGLFAWLRSRGGGYSL